MKESIKNFPAKTRFIISLISLMFHIGNTFDSGTLEWLPGITSLTIKSSAVLMVIHTSLVIVSLLFLIYGYKKGVDGNEIGTTIWKFGIIINNISFICLALHLALTLVGMYYLVPQSLNIIN